MLILCVSARFRWALSNLYGIVVLQNRGAESTPKRRTHSMKTQRFGVEIELTGITRRDAAKLIADYFGTTSTYEGTGYNKYSALDRNGRKWTAMYDSSIDARDKNDNRLSDEYKCELVTPILGWDDIETLQEIVRLLRKNGAIANASCGIHVHVDATNHTAKRSAISSTL